MKFKDLEPLINNRVIEVFYYKKDVQGNVHRYGKKIRDYVSIDKVKEDAEFMNFDVLWLEARSHEYGMLAVGVLINVDSCE